MAKQVIDTTTPQPNGKQGEPVRTAFEKTKSNFDELYARTGGAADLPGGATALLTSDKQANATDTTAGKLLTVGSFGLGGITAPLMANGMALSSLDGSGNGWYRTPSQAANRPPDAPTTNLVNSLVFHCQVTATVSYQEVYTTFGRVFYRRKSGTEWSEWSGFLTRDDIVGAVSMGTTGVPTGSIIERIDNANGTALRFADGTQICFYQFPDVTVTNQVLANMFYADLPLRLFPAPFVGTFPRILPGIAYANDGTGSLVWGGVRNRTNTEVRLIAFAAVATGRAVTGYTAFGFWR